MWLLYRSIVPVEHIMAHFNLYKNKLNNGEIAYFIEDVYKIDDPDEIKILMRKLTTNELSLKRPIDLYRDRELLILFSSTDIQTIIFCAMHQQHKTAAVNLIAFEGYDYNNERESAIFSNVLNKQQLAKNSIQIGSNSKLIDLLQPKDAFYLGRLSAVELIKNKDHSHAA